MLLFTQTLRISASLVSAREGGEGQQKVGAGGWGGGQTEGSDMYHGVILSFNEIRFFYVFFI